MKRREFIFLTSAALVAPGLVQAADFQDTLIAQLQSQGYTVLRITRTWLGRARLIATNDIYRREIIFNPRTGVILRDFSEIIGESGESASGLFNPETDTDDHSAGQEDGGDGGGDDSGSDGGGDDGSDDGSDGSSDDSSDDGGGDDNGGG